MRCACVCSGFGTPPVFAPELLPGSVPVPPRSSVPSSSASDLVRLPVRAEQVVAAAGPPAVTFELGVRAFAFLFFVCFFFFPSATFFHTVSFLWMYSHTRLRVPAIADLVASRKCSCKRWRRPLLCKLATVGCNHHTMQRGVPCVCGHTSTRRGVCAIMRDAGSALDIFGQFVAARRKRNVWATRRPEFCHDGVLFDRF